jgi:hypothetical protein
MLCFVCRFYLKLKTASGEHSDQYQLQSDHKASATNASRNSSDTITVPEDNIYPNDPQDIEAQTAAPETYAEPFSDSSREERESVIPKETMATNTKNTPGYTQAVYGDKAHSEHSHSNPIEPDKHTSDKETASNKPVKSSNVKKGAPLAETYLNPRLPEQKSDDNETPLKRVASTRTTSQATVTANSIPPPSNTAHQSPNTVHQPPSTTHQSSNTEQRSPNTAHWPSNSAHQSPNTARQFPNTAIQPRNASQEPPCAGQAVGTNKSLIGMEETLRLVSNPRDEGQNLQELTLNMAITIVRTQMDKCCDHNDDDSEETPLKHPVEHMPEQNPDIRQAGRQAGRQLSADDDGAEETPFTPLSNHTYAPQPDMRLHERQAEKQLSAERQNPSDPESLRIQERTLEELQAWPITNSSRHPLSITDSLIPGDVEEPTSRLDKYQVMSVLDK